MRWRRCFSPDLATGVDAVPPLHVFVVVGPIGEVMLTFNTRVRTLSRVLSPVSLLRTTLNVTLPVSTFAKDQAGDFTDGKGS